MLAASAPLVANMVTAQPISQTPASNVPSVPPAVSASTSTSTPWKASSAPPPTLSALAAKQQRLQETIDEQKTLMASLETASADKKKDIMTKLRKLGEEMKSLTATASTPETTVGPGGPLPTAGKKSGFDKLTEHERKERERLDNELDMNQLQHENKTEDLKAKLERLKAEVRHFLSLSLSLSSSNVKCYCV
jgi:RNA-binding protein 26